MIVQQILSVQFVNIFLRLIFCKFIIIIHYFVNLLWFSLHSKPMERKITIKIVSKLDQIQFKSNQIYCSQLKFFSFDNDRNKSKIRIQKYFFMPVTLRGANHVIYVCVYPWHNEYTTLFYVNSTGFLFEIS